MRSIASTLVLAALALAPGGAYAQALFRIEASRAAGSGGTTDEQTIVCNKGNQTGDIAGYKMRAAGANGTLVSPDPIANVTAAKGTTVLATNECFILVNTGFNDFPVATSTYPYTFLGLTIKGYASYTHDIHQNGSIAFTNSSNAVQGTAVKFGNNGNTGFPNASVTVTGTVTGDEAAFRTAGGGYVYGATTNAASVTGFTLSATLSGTTAALTWSTATETNNSGFYVEQLVGSTWTTVSSLVAAAGTGTSTTTQNYTHDVTGLAPGTYTFRIRQVSANSAVLYSNQATVTHQGVTGLAFSASSSGTTAALTWSTATETNNSGFYVEQLVGSTWTTVSSLIAGAGTSSTTQNYSYDVTGLDPGTHTFRIRQVSANNAEQYSSSRDATFETLPVELTAFAGVADGAAARLAWTTVSETNNLGFYVEQRRGDTWHDVSDLIAGHGTTTERHDYGHAVAGLTAGTYTFRLRQLDTDGTVHHSAIVTVEIVAQEPVSVTLLGHGSAQPRVRVVSAELASYELAVVDLLGRTVAQNRLDVSGTAEWAPSAPLAPGVYVLRVVGERDATVQPLLVR